MKISRYIRKYAAGTYILLQLLVMITFAVGNMKVMETHTGDTNIAIYVKGMDEEVSDASVQIGTESCASVESGILSELKYQMKTLVMLDNSLSIPQAAREKIAGILQNIISDRESYEEIAIAVYDDSINYLTEYTSDYTTLKAAIDSISYQDLETHLTSVLYDLMSKEYIEKTESSYWRIVVISDGIDDQSVDSTREELYTLMKEKSIPIYTIGMQTGKNQGQLADLFALSRQSNADSFVLDDMEELLDINSALNTDRCIVRFSIVPKDEQMDGGRKTVRISLPSGNSVSVEMSMPQQERSQLLSEEPQTDISLNRETEPEVEFMSSYEPESDEESMAAGTVAITAVGAVILMVVIITVLIVSGRRKMNDVAESENQEYEDGKGTGESGSKYFRHTIILKGKEKGGNTFYIFGNKASDSCNIILTDMDSTIRTFSYPLKKMAVIGADTNCEIPISNDECMSWRHCRIEAENGKFYLEDMQSTNGTFLNDVRISSKTEIVSGDRIQIGDTKLKFEVQQ